MLAAPSCTRAASMQRRPLSCSPPAPATLRPPPHCLPRTTTCHAHQQQCQLQSLLSPGLMLSSLAASSLLLLPPGAAFAAPQPEEESFGAARTRELVEQQGTPGAARPDTMRTNVPFQAPGINAPPRTEAQEQGTTAVKVLKNAAKNIKANNGVRWCGRWCGCWCCCLAAGCQVVVRVCEHLQALLAPQSGPPCTTLQQSELTASSALRHPQLCCLCFARTHPQPTRTPRRLASTAARWFAAPKR